MHLGAHDAGRDPSGRAARGTRELSSAPACCRWCRPISSISPALRWSGWPTPIRQTGSTARHAAGGAAVRLRLLHRVRRARRQRQRHRRADPRLFGRALHRRRHRHHHHGAALPRRVPHRRAASGKAHGDGQAGRPVGRLCDGACLRVRLDALHRADPGGDPGGRGLRADGGEGRGPARGLFARASAFRSCWRLRRSSRSRRFWRASAGISPAWSA